MLTHIQGAPLSRFINAYIILQQTNVIVTNDTNHACFPDAPQEVLAFRIQGQKRFAAHTVSFTKR